MLPYKANPGDVIASILGPRLLRLLPPLLAGLESAHLQRRPRGARETDEGD